MSDCMTFPETVEEFMEFYKVVDTEQVYSNGTEYVPIFRMRQWFEHLQSTQQCTDTISRQAAIDAMCRLHKEDILDYGADIPEGFNIDCRDRAVYELKQLPSAQPERKTDIIQKFHDYQIEWLKSHYDIELEPQLEEMIVRFLHDTANCYMMEVEHETD